MRLLPKPTLLSSSIVLGMTGVVSHPAYCDVIQLSDIGSSVNGFVIQNSTTDSFGFSVASAGDLNGDGINDIIISAPNAYYGDDRLAGEAYIIFGDESHEGVINIGDPTDTTNSIKVIGGTIDSRTGSTVNPAGDLNADGMDDVMIGAAKFGGIYSGSRGHVIFGDTNSHNTLNLRDLNLDNAGFTFSSEQPFDAAAYSLSDLGDINGDGISDIIISAANYSGNGISGRCYVVFGGSQLTTDFNLSEVGNSIPGTVINGPPRCFSTGNQGDYNHDGLNDILIGAPGDNSNALMSGRAFVIFGRSNLPSVLNLSETGSSIAGFTFGGVEATNRIGRNVAALGDFNADGIDDFVVSPNPDFIVSINSYIVFGDSSLSGDYTVSDLNTTINGIELAIYASGAQPVSNQFSTAGDLNGDGINDLLFGNSGGDYAVIIYGSTQPPDFIRLSDIESTNAGIVVNGSSNSLTGSGVANIGDFNNDLIDDIIIGTGGNKAAYVIYGTPHPVDLSVSINSNLYFTQTGDVLIYKVTFENAGNSLALDAVVNIDLSDQLSINNASWICSANTGATCTNNGTGNIVDIVDMPASSTIVYQVTADVIGAEGNTVVTTAAIDPRASSTDLNAINNSASSRTPIALFSDGMESVSNNNSGQ